MDASEESAASDRDRSALHRVEDAVLAVLLTGMILLASLQIFLRNFFDGGIGWADPAVRVLVLWVGLLGALAAARSDEHIHVDVLSRLLPDGAQAVVRVITSLFTAAVAGFVAWQGGRFVLSEWEFESIAFASVPTWLLASIIPFAFGGIAVRYLAFAATRAWRRTGEPASG